MSKLSKEVDGVKYRLSDIENRLFSMNERINNNVPKSNIVSCEVCGCAILIEKAIKGKGIVKTVTYNSLPQVPTLGSDGGYSGYGKNISYSVPYVSGVTVGVPSGPSYSNDYIYYPYYCKLHVPEELIEGLKKRKSRGRKL